MKPSKYIYMMVTNDRYELPIMVADSSTELAVMVGCDPTHITRTAKAYEDGKRKSTIKTRGLTGTFRRIPINREDIN